MKNKNIGVDAAVLAGLQIDILQKFRDGHIAFEHLKWFLNLSRDRRDELSLNEKSSKGILHIIAGLSVEERIKRGNYGYVKEEVFEEKLYICHKIHFDYDVEYKLFCFKKIVQTSEAIKKIKSEGFRPASIIELLAFGETYPNFQIKFPVIALGTSWIKEGTSAVYWPTLGYGLTLGGREISLRHSEYDIHLEFEHFLCVRNKK